MKGFTAARQGCCGSVWPGGWWEVCWQLQRGPPRLLHTAHCTATTFKSFRLSRNYAILTLSGVVQLHPRPYSLRWKNISVNSLFSCSLWAQVSPWRPTEFVQVAHSLTNAGCKLILRGGSWHIIELSQLYWVQWRSQRPCYIYTFPTLFSQPATAMVNIIHILVATYLNIDISGWAEGGDLWRTIVPG